MASYRGDTVINRLYSGYGSGRVLDISKRPELAFYSRDKSALTGKLLKQALNQIFLEGKEGLISN